MDQLIGKLPNKPFKIISWITIPFSLKFVCQVSINYAHSKHSSKQAMPPTMSIPLSLKSQGTLVVVILDIYSTKAAEKKLYHSGSRDLFMVGNCFMHSIFFHPLVSFTFAGIPRKGGTAFEIMVFNFLSFQPSAYMFVFRGVFDSNKHHSPLDGTPLSSRPFSQSHRIFLMCSFDHTLNRPLSSRAKSVLTDKKAESACTILPVPNRDEHKRSTTAVLSPNC